MACCGESRFWSSSCAIDGPLFPSISYRVILPWKSMAGRCSVCHDSAAKADFMRRGGSAPCPIAACVRGRVGIRARIRA